MVRIIFSIGFGFRVSPPSAPKVVDEGRSAGQWTKVDERRVGRRTMDMTKIDGRKAWRRSTDEGWDGEQSHVKFQIDVSQRVFIASRASKCMLDIFWRSFRKQKNFCHFWFI